MFEKWFGTRSPRPLERSYSFRPELECLEGRLAPSALMPMDNHGHGHGPPGHGEPPPGHGHNNNNNNVHINAHDSFNTTIVDSFNTAINNIIVNQYFSLGGGQQELAASLFLAAQQDFTALTSLAAAEVALAQDTIFALEGGLMGMANSNLAGVMHNLQNGIMSNPLEGSLAGQLAGSLVFNATINQIVNVNHSPGATVTVTA